MAPRTDTFGRSAVRRGREGGSGHGPSPRDPPAKRSADQGTRGGDEEESRRHDA